MHTQTNQAGFTTIMAAISILVLGVLGFAGWKLYVDNNTTTKSLHSITKVMDYAGCKKASGSITQETYPDTCVTKGGESFINTAVPKDVSALMIKEWGVKLPLTATITDARYTFSDASNGVVHLTTQRLQTLAQQVGACRSGIDDVFITRASTASAAGVGAVHVGSYYYFRKYYPEPACVAQVDETVRPQVNSIEIELTNAIKQVVAS